MDDERRTHRQPPVAVPQRLHQETRGRCAPARVHEAQHARRQPGLGQHYLGAAEGRWRFLGGKLYALGTGGTQLFPEAEGALRPGAFASGGLGVDPAR